MSLTREVRKQLRVVISELIALDEEIDKGIDEYDRKDKDTEDLYQLGSGVATALAELEP